MDSFVLKNLNSLKSGPGSSKLEDQISTLSVTTSCSGVSKREAKKSITTSEFELSFALRYMVFLVAP